LHRKEKLIMKTYLVSACLLGVPCRWHGKKIISSNTKKLIKQNTLIQIIQVCPEVLGGLPVPRPPVKRIRGRVFETCPDKSSRKYVTGNEVTQYFRSGAAKTLEIAIRNNVELCILCSWSPSCDITGITGKLLAQNGFKIINTF